jgi:predicted ATP-binding protein involved in virulence
MLTGISLQRFRGFRKLDADLRPVTVVMGPNSSGKTSVLHAIRVALEALSIALEEAEPHLDDDGQITVCWGHIVWDHARLHPMSDWAELFTDKEIGGGAAMSLTLRFDAEDVVQEVWVELSYARNYQLKMSVRVRSASAAKQVAEMPLKSRYRKDRLKEVLSQGAPRAFFVPAFYGVTGEEEHRTRALMRRLLGGGDQSRVVRNVVARLDRDAFTRLNNFLGFRLGATISRRTTEQEADDIQHLAVYFKDTNGELELSAAGAGLINLVALYAVIEELRPRVSTGAAPPVIYLLDEPEAHLHPKLQGDVGAALASAAAGFGAQLVIATHSIEMINRLGRQRDTLLLAVDRTTSRASPLGSEAALVRELGQWCDLTPFTSLNFLASRRILFHEGPSDAAILARCADAYFRTRAPDLDAFRRWTLVSLDGVGNVKAQGVLGAVLSPQLFPDLDAREVVRAVCVMDRDAERAPGFRVLPKLTREHFEARELVWSRYSIESLFLTPALLAFWIEAALPEGAIGRDEIQDLITRAIAAADKDPELVDAAEVGLQLAKIRQEHLRIDEALKAAKAAVRAEPGVYQRGRDRARRVLAGVRDALPSNALKNALPASIQGLLDVAVLDRIGDRAAAIPQEIRDLLEYMASPPARATGG